jgi:hypothetical protein
MVKAQIANKQDKRQLPPAARWLQAGLAFGLAFVLGSWAIDSGSLLQYAAATLFFALGVSHVVQALRLRGKQ